MIKECNFKYDATTIYEGYKETPPKYKGCALTPLMDSRSNECPGEENCILYQLYKMNCWVIDG